MINQKQIYLDKLSIFEKKLNDLGYFKSGSNEIHDKFSIEKIEMEYVNIGLNLKISLNYTYWNKKDITLNMTMIKMSSSKTFFALDYFLDKRGLKDSIQSKLAEGGDFEPFVVKYFQGLRTLCDNELNDQLVGKSFEDHIDILNDSWNQHMKYSGIGYEMEKKEVADFIKNKKN